MDLENASRIPNLERAGEAISDRPLGRRPESLVAASCVGWIEVGWSFGLALAR